MSRIEKNTPIKKEIDNLKKDLSQQMKPDKKKSNFFLTCGLIAFFVFVVVIGLITWSLAATGLVSVPIFSSFAYNVPSPTYVVEAGPSLEVHLQNQIATKTVEAMQTGGDMLNGSMSITLPETGFTTSLRSVIEESAEGQIDSENAQIAILEGQGLEVFLPLANNENESALVILLAISPQNDMLVAEIENIKIGAFRLPEWLSNLFIEPLVNNGIQEINKKLEAGAAIESIEYHQGELVLIGSINEMLE